MQHSDRKPFLEIIIGFAELKGKALSAPALELYWNSMQDWDLADFRAAANRLIKTAQFMPTPKDFEDLRRAGRMTAGEAFTKAVEWARSGIYKAPAKTPDAVLIDRVVAALGGWSTMTSYDSEKLHFLERRFTEHFEQMQEVSETRAALPQIALPSISRNPVIAKVAATSAKLTAQ